MGVYVKIVIAGGTGLIGETLSSLLVERGHEVFILTRDKKKYSLNSGPVHYISWLHDGAKPEERLGSVDVMINLAGSTINTRWSSKGKEKIVTSRLSAVDELHRIINKLPRKPKVFVNASAIGFYGTSEKEEYTERTEQPGNDFLADTVVKWETSVKKIEKEGIRTVLCRFGLVLDDQQGAFPLMLLPYRFFIGGTIGSGNQWVSWIHVQDVVRAILFVIENELVKGPVNFTAPSPVPMKKFGRAISYIWERPHWLPVPSFVLKVILGEMSLLLLKGQYVFPEKLLKSGFVFHYPELEMALKAIANHSNSV